MRRILGRANRRFSPGLMPLAVSVVFWIFFLKLTIAVDAGDGNVAAVLFISLN
jgi:hypothetical protein